MFLQIWQHREYDTVLLGGEKEFEKELIGVKYFFFFAVSNELFMQGKIDIDSLYNISGFGSMLILLQNHH